MWKTRVCSKGVIRETRVQKVDVKGLEPPQTSRGVDERADHLRCASGRATRRINQKSSRFVFGPKCCSLRCEHARKLPLVSQDRMQSVLLISQYTDIPGTLMRERFLYGPNR